MESRSKLVENETVCRLFLPSMCVRSREVGRAGRVREVQKGGFL